MAIAVGLAFRHRKNFHLKHTMAGINPHSRIYKRPSAGVEAVLCFERPR
jgi:hypothetical protein